jgi:transcriptional regulator with XRE-family HTH domain
MPRAKADDIDDDRAVDPDEPALTRSLHAFVDHVVAVREARNVKQQELAALCGLKPGHMSNIELKKRGVTLATFLKLARGLDLSPAALATYLAPLPRVDTAARPTVATVVADRTVDRQRFHDTVSEFPGAGTPRGKHARKSDSHKAKVARTKKHG